MIEWDELNDVVVALAVEALRCRDSQPERHDALAWAVNMLQELQHASL